MYLLGGSSSPRRLRAESPLKQQFTISVCESNMTSTTSTTHDGIKYMLAKDDNRTTKYTIIGLFKMFSCWILGICNTPKQSEIGWELTWVIHEIKDEDLLANCMQI